MHRPSVNVQPYGCRYGGAGGPALFGMGMDEGMTLALGQIDDLLYAAITES